MLSGILYKAVLNKIKTIDVMWFEEILIIGGKYKYPKAIFKVEESSDFVKSLDKFKLLKMFNLQYMYIVAPEGREKFFKKVINRVDYEDIKTRVIFLQYEDIESLLENPKLLFRYRLI